MSQVTITSLSSTQYCELCAKVAIPLYGQPYWLESAGGDDAMHYFAFHRKGELVALVACHIPLRGVWLLPPCCQHGVLFFTPNYLGNSLSRREFTIRRQTIEALLEALGSVRVARIALGSNCPDALPFYWHGYQLETRYNYLLQLPETVEKYESLVSRLVKRKANALFANGDQIVFDHPLAESLPFLKRFYLEKGISMTHFYAMVRCAKEAISQGAGLTASLYSSAGMLKATYFIALDGLRGYSIATATASNHPYANTALLYEVIKELLRRGYTSFDFEGSMLPGVEPVFRSLGGNQESYTFLSKGKLSLLDRLRLKRHYQTITTRENNSLPHE